jgi:Skp family chaperone for outer membrane proteins
MKKLIVPIIILMTLSACSQLGLSTTEPAEPVDLSGIETQLDALDSQLGALDKKIEGQNTTLQEQNNKLDAIEAKLDKPVAKPKPENKDKPNNPEKPNPNYGRTNTNPMVAGKPVTIDIVSDVMAQLDANLKGEIYEPKIYYSFPNPPITEWVIFKDTKEIDSIRTYSAMTVTTLNDLNINFAANADVDLPFKINPLELSPMFSFQFQLDLEPDNPHYEISNGTWMGLMYQLISVS